MHASNDIDFSGLRIGAICHLVYDAGDLRALGERRINTRDFQSALLTYS